MLKPALKIYAAWFIAGYVLLVTDTLPSWLEWANSVYLILAGCTALVWVKECTGIREALRFFVVCALISLGAERFGVATGLWFGSYRYTDAFAPLLFGVPLAIPFAWCLVLAIGWYLFPGNGPKQVAAAAAVAVALDLLLDPVSAAKQYWVWDHSAGSTAFALHGVPCTNFVSWWVTAYVIGKLAFPASRVHFSSAETPIRLAPLVLALSLELLFVTLAISYRLWDAVLLHLLLAAAVLLLSRRFHSASEIPASGSGGASL